MVCSWCFGCLWPLGDHKFCTLICTLTNNSIHDKTQNPSFFSKKYSNQSITPNELLDQQEQTLEELDSGEDLSMIIDDVQQIFFQFIVPLNIYTVFVSNYMSNFSFSKSLAVPFMSLRIDMTTKWYSKKYFLKMQKSVW